MNNITLTPPREKFDIQIRLLNALKNHGWNGKWVAGESKIDITSKDSISLQDRLNEKPLYYPDVLRLALCLGSQLAGLSKDGAEPKYGVLFFNLNDILVIDKDWYLLTNLSKIIPLTEENDLELQQPIPLDGFLAPELVGANTLPLIVNPSCAYYSLALLCLKTLGLHDNNMGGIDVLMGSKLYYLLQRCMEKNPVNRRFLYV